MAENRKVQLETEVVADVSGLDQVVEGFQQVAQVGQQAGQQAAQGLDAISNAAAPAAQKLDAATSRMAQSIQRATAAMQAGAKGSADFYQALATSRGIDTAPLEGYIAELRRVEVAQKATQQAAQSAARADAFIASLRQQADAAGRTRSELLALQAAELGVGSQASQYIQRLRQVEQGQTGVGMSARATAAAMRTIPAQLQDIAVSLQGGMNPLTVLSQQGSQLATVFGGVGPALRGVGSYVLGLVNPFTVAAAAVAVFGLELARTESQLRQINSVQALLTGTGRSGLFSTADIKEFISELSKAPGVTRSVATEIVAELAKAHEISGGLFRDLGKLAADYARATGTEAPAAARVLAQAFSEPAKGAKELEASLGLLTSTQILTIERLSRMGDVAGAQRVLLDALNASIKGLAENSLTPLQRAVHEVGNAWERLGERMDQSQGLRTANSILAKMVTSVGWLIDHGDKIPTWALLAIPGAGLPMALGRGGEQPFRGSGATGSFDVPPSSGAAGASARDDEIKRALEAAGAYRSQAGQLSELTQRRAAFNHALQESIALYGKDSEQAKRLRDAISGINEQLARSQGQGESGIAAQRAARRIAEEENRRLLSSISGLDFSTPTKLTEGEKKVIQIQEELTGSILGYARANKIKELSAAQAAVQDERSRAALEKQYDTVKKATEAITRQAEAAGQQADSIRQQADAQEAANATFGKSKTAIEEMVLSQLRLQAAEADSSDTFDPRYVAALRQKTTEQQRYVDALKQAEFQQTNLKLDEASRALKEDAGTLQLEISLMGRSRLERDQILAQRRIEVELAKELADIEKLNVPDGRRQELQDKARANARLKGETAANRATFDEWQRTADQIENSLTDALLRGFESGKDFAANFRDTLKNMFSTLVLKPVIQAVMSPVSGALAGITQGLGGSIAGGGGSALGGIGGLAGGIGSLFGAGGVAGSLAAGAGWLTGSTTLMGSLGAAGSLIGTGTGAGILSGLGMGLGALGPIGLGALAAYAIFGGKGGGPKTESGFGIGVPTRGNSDSAKAVADAIAAQYASIAGEFAKDLQVGVFTATDPQGTALTQLAVNARLGGQDIYSRAARLGGFENVGRSQEELAAAITEETNRVVLEALAATNLPDKIGEYLRQLGNIDSLSGGALNEAVQRMQKALTERQRLDERLFELTHTELERVTEARRREREALDETNRALYDHITQLEDLTAAATAAAQAVDTTRGGLVEAYQRESSALQGVVQRHTDYAQRLREQRDSLTLSGSPMSGAERTARAGQSFSSTLSGALGGDENAIQALGNAGSAFIEAAKASARTPAEVAAAVARVQGGLTTAAAASEGRATVAQLQLNAMTQQLDALGVLNTSVLTVGQALSQYLQAISQNVAAQAALQIGSGGASAMNWDAPIDVGGPTTLRLQYQAYVARGGALSALDWGTRWQSGTLSAFAGAPAATALAGSGAEPLDTGDAPFSAGQTAADAGLVPLLRQVSEGIAAMRQELRAGDVASVTALQKMESVLRRWENIGMPVERTP